MKKIYNLKTGLILVLALFFAKTSLAQNVGINATGSAPDASAGLDVSFTNKGMLIPRVALTGSTDVATISSPTASLMVYNTATAGTSPNNVTPGYYYYTGSAWTRMANGNVSVSGWGTSGNSGTSATTNFIGTTDATDVVMKSNSTEALRLKTTGSVYMPNTVGIGSTSFDPLAPEKLLVDGGTAYNNIINGVGNQNSYVQIGVQNKNAGANASSDVVATNNYSSSGYYPYYVDMGINSSGYSNNSANILNQPHTAYIYSVSPQDFYIGNGSANKGLVFFTYGGNTSNGNNSADGTERLRITSTGNIGIGDFSSPNNSGVNNPTNFLVTVKGSIAPFANTGAGSGDLGGPSNKWGTVYATNGTIQTSDRRLKTNIASLKYGLKEVMAMQPVSYNWKTKPDTDNKIGLIAQDVKKIVPEVVVGDEAKENIGMNYAELVPVLINAIKEQQAQIDELKKAVQKLQSGTATASVK